MIFFSLKVITESKGNFFFSFFRQEIFLLEFVYLELTSKLGKSDIAKLSSQLHMVMTIN